jgi:acyl carrier protein
MSNDIEEIKQILKKQVLYDGLELSELGIEFSEITDEVIIIGDEGLALDSVDALEILSLLNRHFGIDVTAASKEFFEEHLARFDKLLAFVVDHQRREAA